MRTFLVQFAQTRNYEIEVTAADETVAKAKAWNIWRDAPELGSYEISDEETDIVACTQKGQRS